MNFFLGYQDELSNVCLNLLDYHFIPLQDGDTNATFSFIGKKVLYVLLHLPNKKPSEIDLATICYSYAPLLLIVFFQELCFYG